ncbi:MAG: hypothetical protein HUJ22_00255 [Gracilimonas sp.]|jgi:hypothetical protein|uniref:hypothetical protein n=1 Tax=Gracilimonas sp. TaxID=1974203 RepID=UPI0019A25C3B|nr:hypothetical protein [Gracilimonas sp.]MBD3614970.1 hypothetical protein [Gracilimonas sp.]
MERIVNIAKSHKEARDWDIEQAISMTPEKRQAIAKELKIRVFGKTAKDVKESHRLQMKDQRD